MVVEIGAAALGDPILRVVDLSVSYPVDHEWIRVVESVSFDLLPGQALGLVGESGCGKSVTALSIMGLTRYHGARIEGSVLFENRDLVKCSDRELADIRGREIGMVFQQALRSLNPAFTVGDQIAEVFRRHLRMSRKDAWRAAVGMLDRVHIPDAAARARDYPHQFSGGMSQRVMIALAMACQPKVLIADEPTTALDVRVQQRILELLEEVCREAGSSVLFISHDLGVIAELCSDVAVMYAGQVTEIGTTHDVFMAPHHPYTAGLLNAIPRPNGRRLVAIPGAVPAPGSVVGGCRFRTRCVHEDIRCADPDLDWRLRGDHHKTLCLRSAELTLTGVGP